MNTKNTRGVLISVLILVGIGILMVYSSTAIVSMRNNASGFSYLWKHSFVVCIGTAALFILSRTDYRNIRPAAYFLLGFSFILGRILQMTTMTIRVGQMTSMWILYDRSLVEVE